MARTHHLRIKRHWFVALIAASITSVSFSESSYSQTAANIDAPVKAPSPNAFTFYVQAGEAIDDAEAIASANADREDIRGLPTAALASLIAKNARALKLVRQGFNHQYQHPTVKDFTVWGPEYAHFHNLTRLLVLEGELKARQGDMEGAMDCYLDGIKLGVDVPRGGGYIPFLVGSACEAISRRPIWNRMHKLDAALARSVAAQLEVLASSRVKMADVLMEDKRMALASIPAMLRDIDSDSGTKLVPHTAQIVQNVSSWMDETSQQLRQPYAVRKSVLVPVDPWSQAVLPEAFGKAGFSEARNVTDGALLATALALRAYQVEKNALPETLENLAPGYLPAIPQDPFGAGEKLRYRLTHKSFVLYSIGPDGKDDAGRGVVGKTPDGKTVHLVNMESKGDVIAGINR